MKTHLFLFLITASAHSAVVTLEKSDQTKIAHLLGKLPTTVREKTVYSTNTPVKGFYVKSKFPKSGAPFSFVCRSYYYNNSMVPSKNACTMQLETSHPDIEFGGDEYRGTFSNVRWARALAEAIPYGSPKKFYSTNHHEGLNFEGEETNIFHYRFACTADECEMRISAKIVKNED